MDVSLVIVTKVEISPFVDSGWGQLGRNSRWVLNSIRPCWIMLHFIQLEAQKMIGISLLDILNK